MKIAIIATHAHPLPSPAHTGDSQVILDLCWALSALGHEVNLLAPAGTRAVGCSVLAYPACATAEEWEQGAGERRWALLTKMDVVHDFSIGKTIARQLHKDGAPYVSTLLGGCAYKPLPNTVVWSEAMRDRVMRGASDYEGTRWPEKGGPQCEPFRDVRVVHGGVDTEFYSPGPADKVGSHFLWLSRWCPEKGPAEAIALARATGIELLMCGEDPETDHPSQAAYAREMVELARGCDNIRFEWLPPDPHHHEAKRDVLRQARAFLMPLQFQEPFGLGMVEAMACGTYCVANGMGSASELNEGYFDLSAADQSWIAKEQGWAIMGRRARDRAVSLFDRRVMAANYVKLYEEVAGGGGWG